MIDFWKDIMYTDEFMWNKMDIYELPQYLYHYTSLDTLALIFKYNTLRFSRLDTVNDMEEAIFTNLPHANTAIFTSSWTAQPSESIPMWRMYTQNMDGVRIKLPINMFVGREKPNVFEKGGAFIHSGSPIHIHRKNLHSETIKTSIQGPNKVYYSDDEIYLYSKVIDRKKERIDVNLYDLGLFKKGHWQYEQEWRFKIIALPEDISLPNDIYTECMLNLNKFPVKNTYIDVPLDKDIFNNAEFTLGPRATESHLLILQALVNTYAPNATCSYSNLQIR